MGLNRCIGKENQMPWHCASELQHFQKLTMGHMLLMGKQTFLSIGKPLFGRTTLVLTHDNSFCYNDERVEVVHDLNAILKLYQHNEKQLMVCGGASLYQQTLSYADQIYLSVLRKSYKGDRFFPKIDSDEFTCVFQDVQQEFTCYHITRRKNH